MTTAIAPRRVAGTGVTGVAARAGLALGASGLLLLAAGPLGWRLGWLHYRVGLLTLLPWGGYLGVAAMAVSILALAASLARGHRRELVFAAFGLALGAVAAYFPWHWSNQQGIAPRVNDVTTDLDNPPSLAFAEPLRKAEEGNPVAYDAAQRAAVQQKSYPDIAPVMLGLPPAAAFERALAVATAKRWTIVAADRAAGIIDAYDKSFWFGFTDDIAIRVTAAETGSRIDMRSGARQGRSDFGVNAARVRGFLAALKAQP
jgi:uncharacterized protein (DUF1499 family)